MSRIPPVNPQQASPEVTEILGSVRKAMGTVSNLISVMAQAPSVARSYLAFSQNLGGGALPARLREQLALLVGEANGCGYCVAAHTALGQRAGLSEPETCDARRAVSADRKEGAALDFAAKVLRERGRVTDADVERVRAAGYGDREIAEIVAHVALNVFTNYFNNVAGTEIDFPAAPVLKAA